MDTPKDPRSGAVALGGAALIAFGAWWLVRETGIIPQATLDLINRSAGAITLIGLGVIVLLLSRRGTFSAPRTGTRLYRSRNDRLLGGVLGGLGAYLGIDPLLLRIAVGLLTLLGNGGLVAIYIVMWILVPEEPLAPAPGAYAPAPAPATPAPPAPPVQGA
jgi:phage shock protein PspC (stress-responsive transcriptional regulator)